MTAGARRERRRRIRRIVVGVLLAVIAVLTGPAAADAVAAGWERHIIAEARGDTAQVIAIRVGREISLTAEVPATLTVAPSEGGSGCVIVEIGTPVHCATAITIEHLSGEEFTVTVHRRGESFTYDSRLVSR